MTVDPLDIAAAGGTVLTVNKRLARHLVNQYDQRQLAAGCSVWSSPSILSLDAWLQRLLCELRLTGCLLTEAQSQRLWEEIIGTDAAAAGRDLLQVAQTARCARTAHRLLADYLAEIPSGEIDEEHRVFLRWRQAFRERLRRGNWLDRAELLPTLTAAVANGAGDLPPVVLLAGFDDLPPALVQLCGALEECGCRVDRWTAPRLANVQQLRCAALEMVDEVERCARWARDRLERDPLARIGVVVPQLAEYQGLIERTFRAEFDPAACRVGTVGQEAFTLSLGTPLASEGVIYSALRLLAVGDTLCTNEIGWLLRSPYLGGSRAEAGNRARADHDLRARRRNEWRLAALARMLTGVPRMAAIVAALGRSGEGPRRQLPGEWAEHFATLLERCGWPGDRGIGSREYQAVEHFKALLGQLASLDRVAGPLPRADALATLNRLAAETVFQPEAGEGVIQVLGMLEATGFTFDALWILGLHERALPVPARPNPFLPLALQSRLRMPHADAVRERDFAQRLAERLFAAAPEVIVSWPGQLDGAPLRPSPLVRTIPTASLSLPPSHDPFRALLAAPCQLEEMVDERAAPLVTQKTFTGGTGILTDQALCPFRAFAHHRLQAGRLDATDIGLDGMTRGSLVHGTLERFWRQVLTHATLVALDAAQMDSLLGTAAEDALAGFERRSRCDLPPRLRRLEHRRLKTVTVGWLALERKRPPFRVVEIEQRQEVTVGALRLRTRIDRIDELENGQLAVIDYKTGQQGPAQWLDPRVTEPQLPLYCLEHDAACIGAVLFASIRSRGRDCTFRGLARDPDGIPGLSAKGQEKLLAKGGMTHFDEAIAHWRLALPALGDDFAGGVATVDPVDPRKACDTCDLQGLCRVGERGEADVDDGGGESDE